VIGWSTDERGVVGLPVMGSLNIVFRKLQKW
jgi:hypothetical protein